MARPRFAFWLLACVVSSALAQTAPSRDLKSQAWQILQEGVSHEKTEPRATAVRVLSLLRGEPEAVKLASAALSDPKPEVRTAAAMALGQLQARSAIPQLRQLMGDKEIQVVLAAAHSLLLMKDERGYDVYFAVLTGKRKGAGLISEQLDTLKDTKKMATMGFEEGIGFIPFASVGYSAVRTIMKDDASPVRAAAARVLADDPDPNTEDALAGIATHDKSEVVRAAALDAIARRNHFQMLEQIVPLMSDNNDHVKYTAAAAVLRLTKLAKKSAPKPARASAAQH